MLNVICELESAPTKELLEAFDVNGDGKITTYDAYLILMYEAELITEFPKSAS